MAEQKEVNEQKVRVSTISKSVERIFNIAPYESLKVVVGIEEEIEWSDIDERKRKTKNWTKLLLNDFNETVEDVFGNQDVNESKVFHKKPDDTKDLDADTPKPGLDDLDTLEE